MSEHAQSKEHPSCASIAKSHKLGRDGSSYNYNKDKRRVVSPPSSNELKLFLLFQAFLSFSIPNHLVLLAR
jgi:hypothetical protein